MDEDRPSTDTETQANQLGEHLLRLARTLRLFDSSEQVCCGVTMSQCHALLTFGQCDEMAMTELAGRLGLSVSAATRLADTLVRNDLAERRRPSDDRRVVLLRLTRAGREQAGSILAARREFLTELLSRFPVSDRQRLIDPLGELLSAMGASGVPCCQVE